MEGLILAACRRKWTRFDSIVSAVLKVEKLATGAEVSRSVHSLVKSGKLIERQFGGYSKWRKA